MTTDRVIIKFVDTKNKKGGVSGKISTLLTPISKFRKKTPNMSISYWIVPDLETRVLVVSRFQKTCSGLLLIKSVPPDIPDTTIMSWDDNIVFSSVSTIFLFTRTDIRLYWYKWFCPWDTKRLDPSGCGRGRSSWKILPPFRDIDTIGSIIGDQWTPITCGFYTDGSSSNKFK